ncbi:MAG: hypothetical protein HYU66_03585 [Armatimonadetes bacterium]|nr:hypothetical protein [Armatimonadota bacterium]
MLRQGPEEPSRSQRPAFDGPAIDRAARRGVRKALLRHKLLGEPIVVWRDGKVVTIPAEEIEVPEEE